MNPIPDAAENVPRMFRAQVDYRCQLQRLKKGQEPHVLRWTDEWKNFANPEAPEFDGTVQTKPYRIRWRLITNSGQDDDLIRPIMGAGGWPFIPGSSMKGAFRRVCLDEQMRDRYCGKELEDGNFRPGILRFHGGYPTNPEWKNNLIDLAHPQQSWQVKKDDAKSGGAFSQISLKQTELQFGISSSQDLSDEEWITIWSLWERALSNGLGCRVSCGYGLFEGEAVAAIGGEILYQTTLKGQGVAPTLLGSGTPEFRPNIFKAALRGHALRLFGGFVTWDDSAEALVETLFGGVRGDGTQGLLGLEVRVLNETEPLRQVDTYQGSPDSVMFYDVECEVVWRLVRQLPDSAQLGALRTLIQKLMQFAVLLGGFGKSWRRADHSVFRRSYTKHPIGCHWQWMDESENPIQSPTDVTTLIDATREAIENWIECQPQGFHPRHEARLMQRINPPLILKSQYPREDTKTDSWREVWRPGRVEVWVRESNGDSKVIDWLHDKSGYGAKQQRSQQSSGGGQQSSSRALQRHQPPKANIYRTTVSGYVGEEIAPKKKETRVGCIWHRMYPLTGDQFGEYLELLTFFPNPDPNDTASKAFQTYLTSQREFQRCWG